MKASDIENPFLRRVLICVVIVSMLAVSAAEIIREAIMCAIAGARDEYWCQRDHFDDMLANIEKVW